MNAMSGVSAGNFRLFSKQFDFAPYRTLCDIGDAFDYTGADFFGWWREAGFRKFEVMPLAGPSSAAIAYN
jgi:hypothetical protein